LGTVKDEKFLGQLKDYHLFKKNTSMALLNQLAHAFYCGLDNRKIELNNKKHFQNILKI
jgi:hypothetical protein